MRPNRSLQQTCYSEYEFPRRALAALPLAFGLHVAEEWFGGFTAWTAATLGRGVGAESFLIVNGIAVPVVALVVLVALRNPRLLPAALVVAAVLTLNGVLHALATLAFGVYSPGVVTGVLLYLPLGGSVLLWAFRSISPMGFTAVLLAGVMVHALVSMIAFE
jgi:hypothetical protein